MSSTSLENLKSSLTVPLIVTSAQFDVLWKVARFWQKMGSMPPQFSEYCDREVVIKLLHEDNTFLNEILYQSLESIIAYLRNKKKHYRLGVYLSKDIEIPEWERINILINVDYENIEEKMALWKEIEDKVTDIIDGFKREYESHIKEINRANVLVSTTLKKIRN